MEKSIQRIPANEILFGSLGAIIGLVIASLIGALFAHLSFFWSVLAVVLAVVMATIGADVAVRKREELTSLFLNLKKSGSSKDKKGKGGAKGDAKILDTSVIIDGRMV